MEDGEAANLLDIMLPGTAQRVKDETVGGTMKLSQPADFVNTLKDLGYTAEDMVKVKN